MPKKVLTIGGASHDIFIDFKDPEMLFMHLKDRDQSFIALEEGKKITIDALHHCVGGGAANSAVSFKRLGHIVEAFFKIGTDGAGDFILKHMQQEGVIVRNILRSNEQTGTSYIIPCPSGNKAALVYRGANLTLMKQEIPIASIKACDAVYVTSLSFALAKLLPFIAQTAHTNKKLVIANPGSNQARNGAHDLIAALPYIDILILNSYESRLLMNSMVHNQTAQEGIYSALKRKGKKLPRLLQQPKASESSCFDLIAYMKTILSIGPKIVLVTNGAEGVYAACQDTLYFYPSPKVKVISSVGAGDSFGSAFVASLLDGSSIETALIAGTCNSSSVIQHIGTQTGLLTKEAMKEKLKKANYELIQRFPLR